MLTAGKAPQARDQMPAGHGGFVFGMADSFFRKNEVSAKRRQLQSLLSSVR